mmetsp:Transcript_32840/g.50178  ORF Transcript_32840/g.50178 Transcript_32840/m.50178 type:complete len:83 (+) Transcript_32840:2122-2370(+)
MFRVTTNQRQRNINILNKQRGNIATQSKPRNSRAPPLPNAQPVTDRIKGNKMSSTQVKSVGSRGGGWGKQSAMHSNVRMLED